MTHSRLAALRPVRVHFFFLLSTLIASVLPLPAAAVGDLSYERAQILIRDGRLTEALEYLTRFFEKTPEHAGALLDIALIHCQLGDKQQSENSLTLLEERFTLPEPIRAIVGELRLTECMIDVPRSRAQWSLSAGIGYDNNINQGSLSRSITLGQGPDRIELQLDPLSRAIAGSFAALNAFYAQGPTDQADFFMEFSAQRYPEVTDYDQERFAFGGSYSLPGLRRDLSLFGNAAVRRLGGSLYEQSATAGIRSMPAGLVRNELSLDLEWILSKVWYPGRSEYDFVESQIRLPLYWQVSDTLMSRTTFGHVLDAAQGDRPGGDRKAWILTIEGLYRPSKQWTFYGSLHFRNLRGDTRYAEPLLNMVQHQRYLTAGVAAEKMMTSDTSLRIEYRFVRNHDSVPLYRYTSNAVGLYWIKKSM